MGPSISDNVFDEIRRHAEEGLRRQREGRTAEGRAVRRVRFPSSAFVPSREVLEAALAACVWASLRTFEGRHHRLSLAFRQAPAEPSEWHFVRSSPCTSATLSRLAPVIAEPRHDVFVQQCTGPDPSSLEIWGSGRSADCYTRIVAPTPGDLRVVVGAEPLAVLVDGELRLFRLSVTMLRTLLSTTAISPLGAHDPLLVGDARTELIRVLTSLHAGGCFVFLPEDADVDALPIDIAPEQRFMRPRAIVPRFLSLHRASAKKDGEKYAEKMRSYVVDAAGDLASLAVADGAVLCSQDLSVIAFGAKLRAEDDPGPIQLIEPLATKARPFDVNDFTGTRHKSAARFAHHVPGALVLVVSHDGPASLFVRPSKGRPLQVLTGLEYLLTE